MKVLMINTVPTDKNGITAMIFNIIQNIDHNNLQIDLVSINTPDDKYGLKIEKYGGKIIILPRENRYPLKYFNSLISIIKENKYDAVHAHGNSHTLALEMMAAKIAGCKKRIAHSHSTSCVYKKLHLILGPIFYLSCNYRIACSNDAGKWMYKNKSFITVNNGIDIKKFEFNPLIRTLIRKKLQLNPTDVLIGHVGDFHTTNKNQHFLLELIMKLRAFDSRYKLILIGDGKLRSKLQEIYNSDSIFFTGSVSNVYELINSFDLFVLPSVFEGVPLTAIEAQANGLKCILSSTISTSVNITNNVEFLDIELDKWFERIKSCNVDNNRETISKKSCVKIGNSGFDLETECKKLREIYFS